VRKDDPRIAAAGELDELGSALGAALSLLPRRRRFAGLRRALERIQGELFAPGPDPAWLEREQARLASGLPRLRSFLVPGGSPPGALLHLARAVCRRTERVFCALGKAPEARTAVPYLNSLSAFLFTAARWTNRELRAPEPPSPKGSQ